MQELVFIPLFCGIIVRLKVLFVLYWLACLFVCCLLFTGGWCVRERPVYGGGKMGQSK